jgi:hypothetical protein
MRVKEIKDLYFSLGGKIFGKKYQWWNIFQIDDFIKAKYDEGPLEEELQKVFGKVVLGGPEIKTGLCIVTKRADTNSVWPFINHPKGKYFDSSYGKNKDIQLWKAVRASTAAPTYFLPELIEVGGGISTAAFVDGGVGMTNNPAMHLLMIATLAGFPFHWKTGADQLFLVSAGTGMSKWKIIPIDVEKNNILNWAQQIPDMFMQDASWYMQTMLQWMSKCDTRWHIDGEIGDLRNDMISKDTDPKALLTYVRYNCWLDAETLEAVLGRSFTQEQIDNIVEMSNAENRYLLYELGRKDADRQVLDSHFPLQFKI